MEALSGGMSRQGLHVALITLEQEIKGPLDVNQGINQPEPVLWLG